MFTIKTIPHKELTTELLDEIIKVKIAAWPYPIEEQKKWIEKNIKDTDIHFILYNNIQPVAYLNLIDIEIEVDNRIEKAFGVGNVCAIEKGKGYGKILMKFASQLILNNNKIGILFCKLELTHYYQKSGWQLNENYHINFMPAIEINLLSFNFKKQEHILIYKGKEF